MKIVATRRSCHPNTGRLRVRIRKTRYWRFGQPITLAYVSDIPSHPKADDTAPPPTPEPPVKRERGPRLTAHYIRKVLGKPEPPRPDQAKYEAVVRRIMREGA